MENDEITDAVENEDALGLGEAQQEDIIAFDDNAVEGNGDMANPDSDSDDEPPRNMQGDQAEQDHLEEEDRVFQPAAKPKNKLMRSVPVKKRPERWIVRTGGIRKSRRLASIKCKQMIKRMAAQLSHASDEDDVFTDDDAEDVHPDDQDDVSNNIPQVDGNYTLLAGDVFSVRDIDYFSRTATDVLLQQPDRAYGLAQYLNLDVPIGVSLAHNRAFFLPQDDNLVRSRILSASEGQLSLGQESPAAPRRPSLWRRRLQRLRGFLDRLGRK